jgi:hypothetical protein
MFSSSRLRVLILILCYLLFGLVTPTGAYDFVLEFSAPLTHAAPLDGREISILSFFPSLLCFHFLFNLA